MSTSRTTRDWLWLTVAAAPVLALTVFLTVAAASWQTRAAMIETRLLEILPAAWVEAESPHAMAYAARTSREATETFRELEASAVAVSSKYSGLLELLRGDAFVDWYQGADTDPRLLEMVDAFLADAEPILETADTLPVSDQSVWLPREFENHYRGRYEPRDLQQLFNIAIKSAIQSRDAERFGNLVALLRRDGLRDLRQELLLDVVPPAMTVSMWSEADAERLDGLLDDLAAAQQPWDATLQQRLVAATRWLLGKPDHEWFHYVQASRTDAPSLRLEFLEDYRKFSQLDIDAPSVLARANAIQPERDGPLATPIDVAVQFPTYGHPQSGVHLIRLTENFLGQRYQLRFARTAVALRLHHIRHGSFPEKLEQLTSLGLAEEALRDPIGDLLYYQRDDAGGATLGNAAQPFVRRGGLRSYQTPEHTLSTVLDQFRMLEFAE